ncbi:hypothetical protein XI07_05235 [Bradyrhizobium sp. CCBAU 11445]|uniref:type IV secretory system conjugative DNA transfer family protein n=1 Tax=Bradyrhizobium sp. CCBAU 11445 TaxID=1630896 RepID=UPI002304FF26|nr:type IV secretory system conjugative DNA transfer family protein [Bradyrhizobium sp. CCBAU 11445]MDA9481418.1 hypothetical protein [Bradyrhizobium sp. CCBAU 11445]
MTRGKHLPCPKHKVLLLLDEAAALGRLEPLERGVGCLRAYCTHLLVSQDMSQLRELYRPSGSCLANGTWTCRCRVRGSEIRFEIIGQATSLAKNQGTSRSNMDMMRQQHSMGLSETGRWLLDTSEVLRLPGRRSLILYRSDILRCSAPTAKVSYRSWGIGACAKSTIIGRH